jgi:methyl-accepting chemotaxis protein
VNPPTISAQLAGRGADSAGVFLRNLKTTSKLLVGYALVIVFIVGVGLMGWRWLDQSNQRIETMYRSNVLRTQYLTEVFLEYKDAMAALDLSLATEGLQEEIAEDDAELQEAWAQYRSFDMTGRTELAATFDDYMARFVRMRDETVLPAMLAGDRAAFEAARTRLLEETDDADDALEELMVVEERSAARTLAESRRHMSFAEKAMIATIMVAVLLSLSLALVIARMIALPLRRTVEVLRSVAAGRLDNRLPVRGRDEIAEMATALNEAMVRLSATMAQMGGQAERLTHSARDLSAMSTRMTESAQSASARAGTSAMAAGEVSRSVDVVASGAAEMTASIQEIARGATVAADVAAHAVDMTTNTNETIGRLGEASDEIGSVVKVINSLAEQTNLLALNATIEAARAGESGKGFAVVANEVKELSQETRKATGDIASRVEAIQTNTTAAVAAIGRISSIIAQINETQLTIASAVEQQSSTTDEISRNVREAATGSAQIAEDLGALSDTAGTTTIEARTAAASAEDLSRMADDLNRLVGGFRY